MKNIRLIVLCIIIFNLFIIDVFAENVTCSYIAKKGSCSEEHYLEWIGQDTVFNTIINIDNVSEDKLNNYINYKSIDYVNNTEIAKGGMGLQFEGEDVSAVKYYEKTGSCPPYFGIMDQSVSYSGHFVSKKDNNFSVFMCLFPIYEIDYDSDLKPTEEIYSCTLYSSNPLVSDSSVNVRINYTKRKIDIDGEPVREDWKEALDEYKKNFNFSAKNVCPINELKICTNPDSLYIFPSDYADDTPGNCGILDSAEKITTGDTYCGVVSTYIKNINNGINIKENYNYLKAYCGMTLKYEDYSEFSFSCLNMCLDLDEYVTNPIYKTLSSSFKCGFSGKLILFIANIVKWIKYIVPVSVIVLGILDFIKAIGAGKDEEMKKAQGHFVKRLIVAALIFIIPFIIEFILNVMGFEANGCGIIDL